MRPYGIRKEDGKYIQPVISQATGSQPSPLALLAATCSRIGDTFQEDTTIFTHKNIVIEKGRDEVTTLKSCVDIRPNAFICSDRNVELLQQQQQHTSSCQANVETQQINNSFHKIKNEESFDYNHNCEGVYLCPNVITETRQVENQVRSSFTKSCSRDAVRTISSCGHNTQQPQLQQHNESSFNFNTSPSCEHAMPGQVDLSADNTCAFQDTQPSSTQQSSCSLDNVSLPASALSHVPPITQSLHYTALESYHQRVQKQYQQSNWQTSQQQYQRSHSMPEDKTACLQHESFSPPTPSIQSGYPQNTPYSRHYNRHSLSSLSHMGSSTEQSYDRTTHHGSVVTTPQEQYYHPNINTNSTSPHSYHYPTNFSMDVKQEPYTSQQQHSPMATNYPTPTHIMQPPTPQPQQTIPPHLNMSPVHNHPAGMTSSFCNVCNPQSGNTYMPDLVNGPPSMATVEMQSQNLAEYQYQQQQMMYARDNRRPRRIACTCPNCRDGENKTVTTKDGKQRKLHVCHIPGCGKIYGKTSHLRAHLRWHAGERPFACNWLFCNKRFTRSDELQRHRRTHTGDKRFECSVCLKKFMRSDHLSKHMKTHQTQKQKTDKTENNTNSTTTEKTSSTSSNEDGKEKEEQK